MRKSEGPSEGSSCDEVVVTVVDRMSGMKEGGEELGQEEVEAYEILGQDNEAAEPSSLAKVNVKQA